MTLLDPNKKQEDINPFEGQIQKDDGNPKNRQKDWWRYLVEMATVIATILKILEFLGF